MDNSKSNQEFKSGDTVQLKLGGPTMIVKDPYHFGWVLWQWFAGKKLEQGDFSSESLIRVDINEKEK